MQNTSDSTRRAESPSHVTPNARLAIRQSDNGASIAGLRKALPWVYRIKKTKWILVRHGNHIFLPSGVYDAGDIVVMQTELNGDARVAQNEVAFDISPAISQDSRVVFSPKDDAPSPPRHEAAAEPVASVTDAAPVMASAAEKSLYPHSRSHLRVETATPVFHGQAQPAAIVRLQMVCDGAPSSQTIMIRADEHGCWRYEPDADATLADGVYTVSVTQTVLGVQSDANTCLVHVATKSS